MSRPTSKRNLDRALERVRGDISLKAAHTIMANAVVASLIPNGVVKGGTGILIRCGGEFTRATNDLDVVRASDIARYIEDLEDALHVGWEGFTGDIIEKPVRNPNGIVNDYLMRPYDIKMKYESRPFNTVTFDIGFNELDSAFDSDLIDPIEANRLLEAVGFPPLQPIPILKVTYQIAQKLHGVSGPGSRRAHDLIDLQVLFLTNDLDYKELRYVCERLFRYRNNQSWPPMVVAGENWDTLYEAQMNALTYSASNIDHDCVESRFSTTTRNDSFEEPKEYIDRLMAYGRPYGNVQEAVAWVNAFIETIANA